VDEDQVPCGIHDHNLPVNPIGGKHDDWFELYNYSSNAVDLAGCYLTHSAANPVEFQVPAGYIIPPHGFLLVWADKKTPTGSGDLHVNFKLSKSGTSIGLYWTNASLVDYVTFGAQTDDISMGRYPDGSGNICTLPVATPRTNNIGPNTAPVESALSDQFLYLGQSAITPILIFILKSLGVNYFCIYRYSTD